MSEQYSFPIGPVLEYLRPEFDLPADAGRWQKLRCAFHGERNASATVNFELGKFRCWVGCTDNRAEDAVGLLMRFEGLTFSAAVTKAEEITGESHDPVRRKRASSDSLFDGSWYQ